MSFLSLLPSWVWAGLAALVAAGLGALKLSSSSYKAGANAQKAKEAEARAKNLDRIRAAADAKPSGSVSNDPHNRDN